MKVFAVVSLVLPLKRKPVEPTYFPYGEQSLAGVRKGFFVDKSEALLRLVKLSRHVVCQRPPRWGKTLGIDTLANLVDRKNSKMGFYVLRFNLANPGSIDSAVRSFVRRYELHDVRYHEDAVATLEDLATVLRDSDPAAELFVFVDDADESAGRLVKAVGAILPVRSFVTGRTPISLDESTLDSVSFNRHAAGAFGFTKDDVKAGLAKLHLTDEEKDLALRFAHVFFDGYLFYPTNDKTATLYNPQLCLRFLATLCHSPQILHDWRDGRGSTEDFAKRAEDPNSRVSQTALDTLCQSPLGLADVATLAAGDAVEAKLSSLDAVDSRLAFMFAHGIVTFDARDHGDSVYLRVPNEIVRVRLREHLRSRFEIKNSFFVGEPTAKKVEQYLQPVFDSIHLDNTFGEAGLRTVLEAAFRTANVDVIKRGHADILVVVDNLAVLFEVKRVRPYSVCNEYNDLFFDPRPFSSDVEWDPPALYADFDNVLDALDRHTLEGLTVQNSAEEFPLRQVRDYFDIADRQLARHKPDVCAQLRQRGHTPTTDLHMFSVVQVGRRVLARRSGVPRKVQR